MTRRHIRAVTTAILAIAGIVAGVPGPVAAAGPTAAAVPDIGLRWNYLMKRSLNVEPETVRLKKVLASQQAAVPPAAAEVTRAQAGVAAAQARLVSATTADQAARARLTAARRALVTAKNDLARLARTQPNNKTAITRAKKAVVAANNAVLSRVAQAQRTTAALGTARTDARVATVALSNATAVWTAANAAVEQTRKQIVALGNAAGLAAMAAKISQDVVTQMRPAFTVADTTKVYGITVHKIVAIPFKRMLDDAKADGIVMSGGGFRTKERQIELRKINGCPDIWTAPASSCRVPTAIPGRSLHEIGLAVDMTYGGKTLTKTSPAFKWLTLHAKEYGFVNLPAEAWHWSITGG